MRTEWGLGGGERLAEGATVSRYAGVGISSFPKV